MEEKIRREIKNLNIPDQYLDIFTEEIVKNNYIYDLDNIGHCWSYGNHYGYPQCCICQFVINCSIKKCEHNQDNIDVSNETGFIPCDYHTMKIKNNEKSLSGIIEKYRRYSKRDFPYDSRDR